MHEALLIVGTNQELSQSYTEGAQCYAEVKITRPPAFAWASVVEEEDGKLEDKANK